MCVYEKDSPEHFDVAIESVINQTLQPSEIVLTVDGPVSDSIDRIINKYQDLLISSDIKYKVIRLEQNVGHGAARRICFDNCSYSLIALMDADDIAVPERFEWQIQYISEHPDVTAVGGYIKEFITMMKPDDTTNEAGRRMVPQNDSEIKDYMKKRCPMNQVTVMFKKDDVVEVGG